jgi:hypothetical protein
MNQHLSVAEAASRYADAGWPVHPLHDTTAGHCSCAAGPDCRHPGKHPRTRHGFHDATRDTVTVEGWWRRWPTANIGVPTGPTSRLVVIDLDGITGVATWERLTNGRETPLTATANTPHGRHHWYRLPSGIHVARAIRGLGNGIDLLGNGGYAIAPPSAITACPKLHDDDNRCAPGYTWTPTTRHLAQLPEWIPVCLRHRAEHAAPDRAARPVDAGIREPHDAGSPTHTRQVRYPRRYALAALRGEADRLAKTPPGNRNDTLFLAVRRIRHHVRAGVLTEHEVRHALTAAADASGHTADDGVRTVRNTITSALRSGGTRMI